MSSLVNKSSGAMVGVAPWDGSGVTVASGAPVGTGVAVGVGVAVGANASTSIYLLCT